MCLEILDRAGVPLNASEPWSLHVHNEKLWDRIIEHRQLGLAQGYMDGWWDCDPIDEMPTRLLSINVLSTLSPSPALAGHVVKSKALNRQTKSRAARKAKYHYNIGNDLYTQMLIQN